jgi:hypothetical protein
MGTLRRARSEAVAHLDVAELALDHAKRVLDLGPDAGLDALNLVGQAFDQLSFVQQLALAGTHRNVPAYAVLGVWPR